MCHLSNWCRDHVGLVLVKAEEPWKALSCVHGFPRHPLDLAWDTDQVECLMAVKQIQRGQSAVLDQRKTHQVNNVLTF